MDKPENIFGRRPETTAEYEEMLHVTISEIYERHRLAAEEETRPFKAHLLYIARRKPWTPIRRDHDGHIITL